MATSARAISPTVEAALGLPRIAEILGVHARTVERRRAAAKKLRPIEVQREEKLHRIWDDLLKLFEAENAVLWLKTPLPVLEHRRPLDVMAEDGGLDRVLAVVGRMSWGIPA